jgi:hypothetical protein
MLMLSTSNSTAQYIRLGRLSANMGFIGWSVPTVGVLVPPEPDNQMTGQMGSVHHRGL